MANTDVTGFWKIAEADPDHLALVDPDHDQMTYGELYALTNKIVRGLRAAGLEKGDQVTTVLPNSFEQVIRSFPTGVTAAPRPVNTGSNGQRQTPMSSGPSTTRTANPPVLPSKSGSWACCIPGAAT